MVADVLIVPLVAAVACLLPIGALARWLAVASGIIVALVAGASLWLGYDPAAPEPLVWAAPIGASFSLGADGFSGTLLVLTGVLFAAGAAASAATRSPRAYFALWCLLQVAVSGVLVARDLILFFLFWEAMLVPLSLLMWQWGGPDRRGATFRFLLYTMAGSALLLVGIVSLGIGAHSFDVARLSAYRLSPSSQVIFALLFLAAFAVKLPLFPFHAWLPRAYAAAPIPVALVLSGVVAKTAVYGIVRICGALFPAGMLVLAPYLVALATVGTLYGALLATRQRDTRTLIAFSSLSHLNLIGVAAFLMTPGGEQAALLASVSHGLVVAALFLLAAALAKRIGDFSFGSGGLGAGAPVLAAFTTLAVVAAVGVPGTSGFAGEFLVLVSAFDRYPGAAAVATSVVIVAAVYGLRFLRAAFFGPPSAAPVELGWRERAILIPLLALVIAVGVAPRAITDLVPAEAGAAPVTVR